MFPDQRDALFGREPAIAFLRERASRGGLTSIVARPLMGKTWTLLEVARREVASGGCLVGYHESKGAEGSHLLYAVADLYAAWLSDSSLRDHAASLWERHRTELVPRVGRLVGTLFEKLGEAVAPKGVAGLVRAAFDGLADVQQDLVTGGLGMASLSYDEARSTTALVAKLSGCRVLLILDAWEKSPSMKADAATLDAFLKHPDDWPAVHVMLGIRSPDVGAAGASDAAFRHANGFAKLSAAAVRHDLGPLVLDRAERVRLVEHLHAEVPATRALSADDLVRRIDGFAGIVGRWTADANRASMTTADDLDREATTVQTLRYLEFDTLLPGLQDAHRVCAARLALLPRLAIEQWPLFRDIVLKGIDEAIVDDLIDRHVLDNERWPTYGHDTRHAAARGWFEEHQKNLAQRVGESLVEAVAATVEGSGAATIARVGALAAVAPVLRRVASSSVVLTLVDAAVSAFEESPVVFEPSFDARLEAAVARDAAFVPLVAICLTARGARRAAAGDFDAALADFARVVDEPRSPATQRAQSLVNRGIVLDRHGERMAAIDAYAAAIAVVGAPPVEVARALVNRGAGRNATGDRDGALADTGRVLAMPDLADEIVAMALVNHGVASAESGDPGTALADFARVIDGYRGVALSLSDAYFGRAFVRGGYDRPGAIDDYGAAADVVANLDVVRWARAVVNRAVLRDPTDDDGAIADYESVIGRTDAPSDQRCKAMIGRAAAFTRQGRVDRAHEDEDRVIAMHDAPAAVRGHLLAQRALRRLRSGDLDGAIDDLDAAIASPAIDAVTFAEALALRGEARGKRGDVDGEIADYLALVDHPAATDALVARALYNLGALRERRGDGPGADGFYARCVACAGAPPDVAAMARERLARGTTAPGQPPR